MNKSIARLFQALLALLLLGACSNKVQGHGLTAAQQKQLQQKKQNQQQDPTDPAQEKWNGSAQAAKTSSDAGSELIGLWGEPCVNIGESEGQQQVVLIQKNSDGTFLMKNFQLSFKNTDCDPLSVDTNKSQTLSESSFTLKAADTKMLQTKKIQLVDATSLNTYAGRISRFYTADAETSDGSSAGDKEANLIGVNAVAGANHTKVYTPVFFKPLMKSESSFASHNDFLNKVGLLKKGYGDTKNIYLGSKTVSYKFTADEVKAFNLNSNFEFLGP